MVNCYAFVVVKAGMSAIGPSIVPSVEVWYRKSGIFRLAKFSYNKFSSILIFVHMALDQWKRLL